jgi:hypothetical protein
VPPGHILQVMAKQHVISTHARDQVTAHHEGLRESGSYARWPLLNGMRIGGHRSIRSQFAMHSEYCRKLGIQEKPYATVVCV